VTAGGEHPGGLQAGNAGAHHRDTPGGARARRLPVRFTFLRQFRVMQTGDGLAGVDLSPAHIGEHAGPHALSLAARGLRRQRGIGNQRPRHADEIPGAFLQQGFTVGRIHDAAQGHHRHAFQSRAQAAHQSGKGRRGEVHVGHMVLEAGGEVALREGEVIGRAGGADAPGKTRGLIATASTRNAFVTGHFQAQNETAAALGTDGRDNFAHETRATLDIATIFIVT